MLGSWQDEQWRCPLWGQGREESGRPKFGEGLFAVLDRLSLGSCLMPVGCKFWLGRSGIRGGQYITSRPRFGAN